VKGTNHSTIFSLFERVGKELNSDSWIFFKQHIMGEAKAPVHEFCESSTTYEELTQDWENPNLSKSRRIKYLQRLPYLQYIEECPIIWKGVEEGSRGYTISFQSKETTLGLGGSILEESRRLSSEEGIDLEMLRTWSKDASPFKRRVGLTEDCINNVTSLGLSLSKRRVGSTEDCISMTTSSTIG
jgi:hypothetical protein